VTDKPSRYWWYSYGSWTPRWWEWLIPYLGGDEYHRSTWVIHVPFVGFLVIAWGQARFPGEYCPHCEEVVTYDP